MELFAVETKLTSVMREIFGDPDLEYRDSMTADDVSEWDSLSHVDLIVAVESEFGIKLSTGEVRGLTNVGDFARVIAKKAK